MFDSKPADLLRALEWALPYAERAHRAEYGDADTDTAASVLHARAALAAGLAAAGKPRAVTVAERISSLLQAIENCRQSGNVEWESRHGDTLARIVRDCLPSGSGFDCGTVLDPDASTPDRSLRFHAGYHHLNSAGFYDGWSEYRVTARPTFGGVAVTVTGPDRDGTRGYVAEVFETALSAQCPA